MKEYIQTNASAQSVKGTSEAYYVFLYIYFIKVWDEQVVRLSTIRDTPTLNRLNDTLTFKSQNLRRAAAAPVILYIKLTNLIRLCSLTSTPTLQTRSAETLLLYGSHR